MRFEQRQVAKVKLGVRSLNEYGNRTSGNHKRRRRGLDARKTASGHPERGRRGGLAEYQR